MMGLRSLDPKTGFSSPKSRKDMAPNELKYLDVTVPQREESLRRMRAKSDRDKAKDEAYQAMTEGHRTPEAVAKHLKWPLEKARFILGDLRSQ